MPRANRNEQLNWAPVPGPTFILGGGLLSSGRARQRLVDLGLLLREGPLGHAGVGELERGQLLEQRLSPFLEVRLRYVVFCSGIVKKINRRSCSQASDRIGSVP